MEKTVNDAVFQATLSMSRAAAVREHGEEAVNAAAASIDPNSAEYQAIITQADPFHALMEHNKRQQAMKEIGDDPIAYAERIKAEAKREFEAEQAVKQVKAMPSATSLAANPNVGARSGPGWAGPTPLESILGD
jgi:heterodisulfide reductase subunit A-like polyferredoxin